jgi:hypothetical protein
MQSPMARTLTVALLLLWLVPAARAGEASDFEPPRRALLESSLRAFARVEASGRVRNPVLTVIDYALPSSQRRLWVLDPKSLRVVFHEFVAHGRGSASDADPARAVRFGNEVGSRRTSLGTFLTGDAYSGQYGFSLRLEGLDPGVNDRALERAIVMHPADYVTRAFRLANGGRLGRSWGCPALDPAVAPALIERIRAGSVLFASGG